jgi:hypothetical protein
VSRRTTAAEYKSLFVQDEGDIQRGILVALGDLGICAWRQNSGTARGGKIKLAPAGTPDIIGWLPVSGRMLAIEVKKPGEEPAPHQLEWLHRARASGVACTWVRSVREAVAFVRAELVR